MSKSISEIMSQGRKLSLEQADLIEKRILGTITAEETLRLRELEGYLLGLMRQAQAQGVGVGYGEPTEVAEDEDEDLSLDYDEDEPEQPELPFGQDTNRGIFGW